MFTFLSFSIYLVTDVVKVIDYNYAICEVTPPKAVSKVKVLEIKPQIFSMKTGKDTRTGHVTLGQNTHSWVMLLWEVYLVIFPFFFLVLIY